MMIKGQAKIEFGVGDILITPLVKEDFSKGCVVLQNKGTHTIGEHTPAGSFVREEADTLITFSNIESLDVLIERLQKLKAMMCGELEDCGETLEYDY